MKKRMGIVAAVATAMLCSSFAFAAPIKIGLMAPITGAFASEGQDMQKICELMTEELNKAGGINGNKRPRRTFTTKRGSCRSVPAPHPSGSPPRE